MDVVTYAGPTIAFEAKLLLKNLSDVLQLKFVLALQINELENFTDLVLIDTSLVCRDA